MKHSRRSARRSYRHTLQTGMRRFLPAPFLFCGSGGGSDTRWRSAANGQALGCLCRAVKDAYARCGRKRARNWPHKKREKPPGAPQLRKADETEVRKAKEIRNTKMAA